MDKLKVLLGIVAGISIIFILKIASLQIFTDNYKLNAINTSIKQEPQIPQRGYIKDRNGNIIVGSQPVYAITYTSSLMKNDFDTLAFCKLLDITQQEFIDRIKTLKKEKHYHRNAPMIFMNGLTSEEVARLQEKFYKYDAFSILKQFERKYLLHGAGNVLGYINEVNDNEIKKDSTYYTSGNLIGKAGVEKSYEEVLRGVKGVHYVTKDIGSTSIGKYKDGKYDVEMESGKDITLTIDADLQLLAESLLQNKRGAVVALEPSTGEILVLASSPTIDPDLFTGPDKNRNLNIFLKDTISKPMYDRATQAAYPPGSTFKLINGLAALQMGVITDSTHFSCRHGMRLGSRWIKCHDAGSFDIVPAIRYSCNSYFTKSYLAMMKKDSTDVEKNINEWNKIIMSFGLNQYMGNDLPFGNKGLIPDADYYNRYHKKGSWNGATISSNGIGQGEILATPLQMANYTAIIANRGHYITPHIVKEIDDKPIEDKNLIEPKKVLVDEKYFPPVIAGMEQVVLSGTARNIRTKLFRQAGKTGTSQVPHGQRDHSIFVMFAPVDNPKIAVAVIIENGGFGTKVAAPIASLVAEQYLMGKIERTYLVNSIKSINLNYEYRRNYINSLRKKGYWAEPQDSLKRDSIMRSLLK